MGGGRRRAAPAGAGLKAVRYSVYAVRLFQCGELVRYYHARNPLRIRRQVERWLRQPDNRAVVECLGREIHLLNRQCLCELKTGGATAGF